MELTHRIEIEGQIYEVIAEVDSDMLVEIKSVSIVLNNGCYKPEITELLKAHGNTIEVLENVIDWYQLHAEYVADYYEHQHEIFEENE